MNKRILPVVAVVLVTVLGLAGPASAHGAQSLVHVTAQVERGVTELTAEIRYLDGDPNGSSSVTATATSGDRTVTIPMAKTGEPGVFAGRAQLPAGEWALAVEASGASQGTGTARIDVQPAAVAARDGSSPEIPGAAALTGGAAVLLLVLMAVAGGMTRRRVRTPA